MWSVYCAMCAGNFMESFNDILRMEYTSQIFDKKSGFCITVLGTHTVGELKDLTNCTFME